MSVNFSCPILVQNCEQCPFFIKGQVTIDISGVKVTEETKKCRWISIKKYWQEEREKLGVKPQPQPNPNLSVNLMIIQIIKIYKPAFLIRMAMKVKCLNCGTQYEPDDLKSHPDPDGIFIEGYPSKQMVFAQCKKCGRQIALWRIFHELGLGL